MREFEIILLQTQSLSIKPKGSLVLLVLTDHFKTFGEAFVVEFYLIELKLILRIYVNNNIPNIYRVSKKKLIHLIFK
jgi:hypothetical protein